MDDVFSSQQLVAGLSRDPGPVYVPPRFDSRELSRSAPQGVYAGSLGYGSGGPTWLDGYHSKRPPTPPELVNAFKAVAYACIKLNAIGVCKVPLRLYAVRRPGMRAPRRSFAPATDRVQTRIRTLAERGLVGSLNFGLSRGIDKHDEVDEILDHPLLQALEKPNPFFDKPTLMMYLVASLDAIGTSYLYPTRPVAGDGLNDDTQAVRGMEIWPFQAQYVYPVKSPDGRLIGSWRYFGDTYAARELVRIRWFSLRDPYLSAFAPLHACYEQASVIDYYTASVEAILKGGARPDIIVSQKDPNYRFGDGERERFETDINNRLTGPRKGRVYVADGAFDIKTPSYSPVDLGGHILTKEQRLLAANCFDVPISLLQSEDSNRATAQESTHQHQYYGIDPRCALIAAALTIQLAQPVDERLFFLFDDPVVRDAEREAKVWGMKIADGRATPNEARTDCGQPPLEGGDTATRPASVVPLTGPEPEPTAEGDDPAEGAGAAVPAGDAVQDQALNGAQIASLVAVAQNVRDGVIPAESAKAILKAAFPTLDDSEVSAIIDPIEVDDTPEPAPVVTALPQPGNKPIPAEADPERSTSLDDRIMRVLDALEGQLSDRGRHAASDPDDHAGHVGAGATPE